MSAVVATSSIYKRTVHGNQRVVFARVDLDTGDYASGGVELPASLFSLRKIDMLIPSGSSYEVSATPTSNVIQWDQATGKALFYQCAADNAPMAEKGAEAFGAGAAFDVVVFGH